MYNVLVAALMVVSVSIPVFSVASEIVQPPKKQSSNIRVHGEGSTQAINVGLIDVLKQQKLGNYASSTIGDAFDKYKFFAKNEWQETHVKGKTYVDFTGWFKNRPFNINSIKEGITSEGLGVKFVISPDGGFGVVMVSRMIAKTDGKLYSTPLTDISSFLDKVYGNREIHF